MHGGTLATQLVSLHGRLVLKVHNLYHAGLVMVLIVMTELALLYSCSRSRHPVYAGDNTIICMQYVAVNAIRLLTGFNATFINLRAETHWPGSQTLRQLVHTSLQMRNLSGNAR
jgi:hypothetical protein